MKYKIGLLIVASVLFCLSFAQVAGAAEQVVKTLYIDGVKIDQAIADQGLTWPYIRITIGGERDRWFLYNEYVGKMAEFAIYKGVLSDPCILAHYNAKDSNTAYTAAVLNNHPLLWLRFRDPNTVSEATAKNSGSIGIDGTYVSTGTGVITQTTGINADSNAIVFPGAESSPDSAGNCVDVWDGAGDFSSDLDGDVTIELWVNFIDVNSMPSNDYPRFFQHNDGWNITGGYGLMVNNEPNQIGVIGGGATNFIAAPNDINNGQWHHLVVTYDSTYEVPVTSAYSAEVLADSPVLYLQFDQSPLVDSSGNNYWVSSSPLPRIEKTVGSEGNAVYLNGGWVAAANQQTEPCSPVQYGPQYAFCPNDITIEFWTQTPLPEGVDGFAGFFVQSDGNYAPGMSRADTKCRMQFGRPDNPSGPHCYSGDNTWPVDVNWHHWVVEYNEMPEANGSPYQINVQLYRDTVSYKNSTYGPATPCTGLVGPEMDHILIGHNVGSRQSPSNAPYRQYMDEFAIYEGTLSFSRIQAHYYAWQPHNCPELWDRGFGGKYAGDIDHNCKVNFVDFAELALDWARCNEPNTPGCAPDW